ncbi:MAG: tape measure protein, partial [Pseudomonadota bacterium]
MNNNRVIGIELVVDDKGTVKLIKFAESAKQALGQAEQSAEGLDQAMKKGGQQAKSAEGAMEQVERRAGSLAGRVNVLGASFKRLKQAGGLVWSTTRRIASGIFSLQGALVGLGLGYLANDFLKVADNTDRMKIALDQLTNGKGEEWFRKLNDWAFKMPVNTDKAIEAFIRLRAFGLEPTIKQMTTLVDSTIGVGRGEEALESVSRALGQIQARGKLSAEELNQLAEAGISAKSMLADAFGVSVANLEKRIAKGIDSKVAIAALFDQLEARFGGASSKIQQKYSGLMDALVSHLRDFQRQMMESGVMPAIERGLGRIIGKLDELRSSGRIAEWADKAGKAIEGLINRAVNFIDGVINNWSVWEARWEKFKSGASEVWTQTKNVASVVGSLLKIALDGWNNLPPVVREFGLVGALIGGVKGKIIFAAIVGLSALLDKAKEVSKGEPDLHIGGVTVPGSPERGYLFKFRQWLEELKGQKPT